MFRLEDPTLHSTSDTTTGMHLTRCSRPKLIGRVGTPRLDHTNDLVETAGCNFNRCSIGSFESMKGSENEEIKRLKQYLEQTSLAVATRTIPWFSGQSLGLLLDD